MDRRGSLPLGAPELAASTGWRRSVRPELSEEKAAGGPAPEPPRLHPSAHAIHEERPLVVAGRGPGSVAEVAELERDVEVGGLQGRDDRLQVIALLPCHSDLVALCLRADAL